MNAHEQSLYDAAKGELDVLYREVDALRAEFKSLIADMAAQIVAEEAA